MLKSVKRPHLGVGLYSISGAARLLHTNPSRVHRWSDPAEGLALRRLEADESTLTFVELMELHFVKMFRDSGVSLQTIRKASAAAAKKFQADYPFSVKRFDTDGKTLFATLVDDSRGEPVVEDLKRGQFVFEQIVRPFFKKLEYRDGAEVARYWPLEKKGRVVLDPQRKFGKPIDAQTGVPTRAIYDAVTAGDGQTHVEVAEWLGIPLAAVQAAVTFEQSLAN